MNHFERKQRLIERARQKRLELLALQEGSERAICVQCRETFAYYPIVGLPPRRHCSVFCKLVSEGKASYGSE